MAPARFRSCRSLPKRPLRTVEVTLDGLDGDIMSKQKLNLLHFSSGHPT